MSAAALAAIQRLNLASDDNLGKRKTEKRKTQKRSSAA
jgi:hypothetical protein